MVEPPTAFTIHAGRPAKSLATRQVPEVVRLSSQEILTKFAHSLLTNLSFSTRGPASRQTTSMPFCASSLESVPPPAPEPITTTTWSSFRSYFAAMSASLRVLEPAEVVEAAFDVATEFRGRTLVAEVTPDGRVVVDAGDAFAAHGLKERRLLQLLERGQAVAIGKVEPLDAGLGLVELGHAVGEQLADVLVGDGLAVQRLDDLGVVDIA